MFKKLEILLLILSVDCDNEGGLLMLNLLKLAYYVLAVLIESKVLSRLQNKSDANSN